MGVLYTVGYEQRSIEEFVAILKEAGIAVLIDVRENPLSRKPGFSRSGLKARLEEAGVEYIHARFAGTPKAFRTGAISHDETLRLYAGHLDSHPEVLAQFEELVAGCAAAGRRAAIMCFERDPAECHRSELARRWGAARGRRVVDL